MTAAAGACAIAINCGRATDRRIVRVTSILAADSGMVAVTSPEAKISARLTADDTLATGVVAMPMGWGSTETGDPRSTLTGQLISLDRDFETINFMPRQTAIPVEVTD